ncbi:MAG: AMP-binding protein [bacterium]|nr:AMP-binding protein [bacterium]
MSDRAQNLNQIFLVAFDAHAGKTCLRVKLGARYRPIRYHELSDLVFRVTAFLRREGVEPGGRVVIVADNSPEWLATYLACLLSGTVAVPLRHSTTPDDLCFMLEDSAASVAVVQGVKQLRCLEEVAERITDLRCVLVVDAEASSALPTTSFAELRAEKMPAGERDRLRIEAERVAPEALASIQYTARETGRPKGAVFEHRQRLEAMRQLGDWMSFDRDDLAFTVMTWAYPPSLLFSLRCLLSGVPNVLAENRTTAFDTLRQASPTLAMVTPYGLERFYNRVMSELGKLPRSRRDVFRWALSIGREYWAAGQAGGEELREDYARADRTFFSQIRAELGGRLRRVYSVGAPLPQHIADFADAIGLEPLGLYGLTEAGGFPAVNRPGSRCPGGCGQVGSGFQIRIADDDEVLVRGDTVMREYWRQPEETREILESDGWLHTGDLGRFDQEGNLYLTGHKRSLFVLSTGRTVTPTTVENALVASPLVAQAIAVGESRPYVAALVVPDLTAVAARLQERGKSLDSAELTPGHPEVAKLFEEVRRKVNEGLDAWERIERLTLLTEPLSEAAGEIKVSMTLNRTVVEERYSSQIDAMYPRVDRFDQGAVTQVQLEPEQLRELFEKQDILDAWMADAGIGFLFEIARVQQIHPPSMVHICETAAAVAQMQTEERPLSTALIVGDPSRIARILPESEIQLQRYDHIRRMRRVVITLAEMVDGLVLGYVLDQNGYVRGIYKLEVALDAEASYMLGPQFRHHAAISRRCRAMVFFVPNGGRQVRVFSDGELVGRYANGNWTSESMERLDGALKRLAAEDGYDLALLQRLLRCAFRMSEDNLGAIFLIGDADLILEHSDPPAVSAFATITGVPADRLSDSELINFAKQDGATVIDRDGHFRSCKVLLRPAAETRAEIGPAQGARHSSAAKMSAEAACLAITVSQDGPITAYESGRRVFSL